MKATNPTRIDSQQFCSIDYTVASMEVGRLHSLEAARNVRDRRSGFLFGGDNDDVYVYCTSWRGFHLLPAVWKFAASSYHGQ